MTESTSTEKAATITREKTFPTVADEPKWLKQERASAWELYLLAPMPTGRHEDWRQTEIETLNEFFGLNGKGGKRGKAPIEWNDERLAKFQKLAKLNSGDVIRYDGKKLKKKSVAILLKVEDDQGKAKTISDLDKITF